MCLIHGAALPGWKVCDTGVSLRLLIPCRGERGVSSPHSRCAAQLGIPVVEIVLFFVMWNLPWLGPPHLLTWTSGGRFIHSFLLKKADVRLADSGLLDYLFDYIPVYSLHPVIWYEKHVNAVLHVALFFFPSTQGIPPGLGCCFPVEGAVCGMFGFCVRCGLSSVPRAALR